MSKFSVSTFAILPAPKSFQLTDGILQAKNRGAKFHLVQNPPFPDPATLEVVILELQDMIGEHVSSQAEADFVIHLIHHDHFSSPSSEAYQLAVRETIHIHARTGAGFLYGIATLRQLKRVNSAKQIEFPKCEVEDYPDIPFRFASRWLIELEGSRMAYDWGDGRDKMLERYRQKINFCMRYKINMVFFEGFEWKTDKYPDYISDMRELNAYARARNVHLEFGGHVIGFGGYPGHTLAGAKGLGGFNRRTYPDGPVYDCGRESDTFDRFFPSITSDAMRNGTCRSNEELNRLKQWELADYVRKIEPGVLYLHSEDIAHYEEFRRMWKHRCESCRRRWPSDDVASPQGGAGAVAYGFQKLYDAIASVQNSETGYDGARDCLVIFASPTYGAYYDTDEDWENVAAFWTAISQQLGNKDRILFCIREQFWGMDNKTQRIPELAGRFMSEGGGHGIFAFAVGGADLYNNSALFSVAPRLNHFYQGAKAIFNFNGGLFASVQEIYNSEYTWNLCSPYGVDDAADYESAITQYRKRSIDMEYLSQDKLLQQALRLCYGEAAPVMEKFYYLKAQNGNFPLSILFRVCQRLFKKDFSEQNQTEQFQQWQQLHKITLEAEKLLHQALLLPLPDAFQKEELLYLKGCLTFGARFAEVVSHHFVENPDFDALHLEIQNLKAFLQSDYPSDFTSSHEGEMNLWPTYLERLQKFKSTISTERVSVS